jgi:hypothetical protein
MIKNIHQIALVLSLSLSSGVSQASSCTVTCIYSPAPFKEVVKTSTSGTGNSVAEAFVAADLNCKRICQSTGASGCDSYYQSCSQDDSIQSEISPEEFQSLLMAQGVQENKQNCRPTGRGTTKCCIHLPTGSQCSEH